MTLLTLTVPDGYAVVSIPDDSYSVTGDYGSPLSGEEIARALANERFSERLRIVPIAWAGERRALMERHAAEHRELTERIKAAPRVKGVVVVSSPDELRPVTTARRPRRERGR